MQSFTDDGVILARHEVGEADRLVVVLTKGHGKVTAVARGIRKGPAKRAALLDLFSVARMQLIPGKGDALTVTEVTRVPGDGALQSNGQMEVARVYAQAAVTEMVDRLTETAQ